MTIFNLSAKNVHHVKILGTGRGQAGKKLIWAQNGDGSASQWRFKCNVWGWWW